MDQDQKIRLSPLTRFSLEFNRHLDFEQQHITEAEFGARLAQRVTEAETRFQKGMAAVARLDAVLLVFAATNLRDFKVFDIPVGKIEFATEALLLLTSLMFVFSIFPFVSKEAYTSLLRQWCERRDFADPDYLQYSHSYNELFIKIFRPQSTLGWRIRSDFFKPLWGFKVASIVVIATAMLILLCVLAAHFLIQCVAMNAILRAATFGTTLSWIIIAISAIANFGGLLILVLLMKDFDFEMVSDPILPAFKEYLLRQAKEREESRTKS